MNNRVWSRRVAAGFAWAGVLLAPLAQAESPKAEGPVAVAPAAGDDSGVDGSASEKLRRLDIMLMVTGLRCRATADDFQADFRAFEARHMLELNAAARALVEQYSTTMGQLAANRALDRISVQIANQYGNGHPWLGCHDLKGLAQSLAQQDGRAALLQAANEILDGDGAPPALSAAPVIAEAAPAAALPIDAAATGIRIAGR